MARERDEFVTESLQGARVDHALIEEYRLVVAKGPDAKVRHVTTSERTVIGTHQSATFKLTDRTMSRFHCEIVLRDGKAFVRDLGSHNGTRVDGVSITEAMLEDGMVLALGATQIKFTRSGEKHKVELSTQTRFGGLTGSAIPMRKVFSLLERAAQTNATVLIQGETGTGKDLAAEAIHRESARARGPFVVVDCSAISPALLESELFGHEKGAFTGANQQRVGALEAASGGTLFLDEIGELGLDLQPKLLGALERKVIRRIGGEQNIAVDVRVVAATNRNVQAEVNSRRFRADLYFRIAVLPIHLPPLRERLEDLPLLVEELLATFDAPASASVLLTTTEFLAHLKSHPWPGNIRELRNYLERCLTTHGRAPLEATESNARPDMEIDVDRPLKEVRDEWTRYVERSYLSKLLARHGHNVSMAARAAGIDRVYFYKLMARSGLKSR